jgi:hypothetical protein
MNTVELLPRVNASEREANCARRSRAKVIHDRQCTYNVTLRRVRKTTLVAEKQLTYFECLSVGLAIQQAKSMRSIILSSVASLDLQYFSTLCHKQHDFRRKVIEIKMCVFIFSKNLIWKSSHSKNNSARYCHKCWNVFMSSASYSCQILNKTRIFSTNLRKNLKYQISSQSSQWMPSCSVQKTWKV